MQQFSGQLEKMQGFFGVEIAERGAGKEADALAANSALKRLTVASQTRRQGKGLGVVGNDRLDRQCRIVGAQPACGAGQVLARNIDRQVAPGRVQRVQQQAHLGQRTSAKLDDLRAGPDLRRDLAGAIAQDAQLGARRIVLGQFANAVEQRRAFGVVKVFGRNAARALCQRALQVGAEGVAEVGRVGRWRCAGGRHRTPYHGRQRVKTPGRIAHQRSFASRSPENCQRAAGGKKLR